MTIKKRKKNIVIDNNFHSFLNSIIKYNYRKIIKYDGVKNTCDDNNDNDENYPNYDYKSCADLLITSLLLILIIHVRPRPLMLIVRD